MPVSNSQWDFGSGRVDGGGAPASNVSTCDALVCRVEDVGARC